MVLKRAAHIAASTLMETLAAMVITTGAFTGGFMIYHNVIRSHETALRVKAEIAVSNLLNAWSCSEQPQPEPVHSSEMDITSGTTTFRDQPDVILVTVSAKDKEGRVLCHHNELFYKP